MTAFVLVDNKDTDLIYVYKSLIAFFADTMNFKVPA
jgi:hypothetical protein